MHSSRFLLALALSVAASPADLTELRRGFERPPDDARILMRWWWFGPAVTKPELEREMRAMQAGGIGGFEIQPVYPLALDDPEQGFRNLPYLSDDFLDALRFASDKARVLGLRVDLTLGSGWPFGGPHIPVTQAAGRLRCDRVPVPAQAHSIPLPDLVAGETLIAAFLAHGDRRHFAAQGIRRIADLSGPRLQLPAGASAEPRVVLFFISSRTGQQVKRAAVQAEGFVLDHYDRAALENHLEHVGDRLMQAFGSHPPFAVFSDSLEVFASDWTPDLLPEFQKRRGYDLTPYLPALVGDIGDQTAAIRHDWGKTLTELADERYLAPFHEWARRHGTRFRSQTYGTPPVVLSSNALVDLPEGEGFHWRGFSTARWAASASHLYGCPVTSSETWTWLDSPAFRATPLDMKAEADLHFLQGINQLIGHGWPYSPEIAGRPGWRFYAAAVFNDHNPWWLVMPEVTRYLQRVSFLLRQGKPANDIAIYLPTDDAWSQFTAGHDSVDRSMNALLGPDLIPQVLDAGYNFDFIDDRAIERVGVPYPVLLLPGLERIPRATYEKLAAYVRQGGILVATRRAPSLAPGLLEAGRDTPRIRGLSRLLFESAAGRSRLVANERNLGAELNRLLAPDFAAPNPAVGFVHRKLDNGDLYFIVNTGNAPVHARARVRASGPAAEWWDPITGKSSAAAFSGSTVSLDLEPYESRVLFCFPGPVQTAPPEPHRAAQTIDFSSNWRVTFTSLDRTIVMSKLHSWTDDDETRFYSGQAVYEKTISVPQNLLGRPLFLSLGTGTPLAPAQGRKPGMRAWLESPVREAALVSVNGRAAGAVWRPPYEVEVTGLLNAGENQLRIVVANLAINALAGRSLPDYRLLNLRYGERFTPQDMDHLEPLASGLLGPVTLVAR